MSAILIYSYMEEGFRDGASLSTFSLVTEFLKIGHRVTLVTCGPEISSDYGLSQYSNFTQKRFQSLFNHPLEISWPLWSYLQRNIATHDVFLLRGTYSMSAVLLTWYFTKLNNRLFVNPLGNLPQRVKPTFKTQLKWFLIKIFTSLVTKRLFSSCKLVICASEAERCRVIELNPRSNSAVIENGVHIPQCFDTYKQSPIYIDNKYAIFLGRISPEKNIEFLISLWSRNFNTAKSLQLHIYGDASEGHMAYYDSLKQKVYDCGLTEQVSFKGPVEGDAKWRALCSAQVLLLPSQFESFGNVVPEALAAGVPVIVTESSCWSRLEPYELGSCLPLIEENWSMAIAKWSCLAPEFRNNFRAKALSYVQHHHSWEQVANKYNAIFQQDYEDLSHV